MGARACTIAACLRRDQSLFLSDMSEFSIAFLLETGRLGDTGNLERSHAASVVFWAAFLELGIAGFYDGVFGLPPQHLAACRVGLGVDSELPKSLATTGSELDWR